MFHNEFYPTPIEVIEKMLFGVDLYDKVILEPNGGKGDIIEYLYLQGAKTVYYSEIIDDLSTICDSKGGLKIASDAFDIKSTDVSHVDLIVMNPPFSNGAKHINHMFEIAPNGCKIYALMNSDNFEREFVENYKDKSDSAKGRRSQLTILNKTIKDHGERIALGSVFSDAERRTDVPTELVILTKPSTGDYEEFNGFFINDDEFNESGLIPYNIVRDLVGRHVEAIKCFDRQLLEAERMNEITKDFFKLDMGMSLTSDEAPTTRNEFIKMLKKKSWKWVFSKMGVEKYSTQKLKQAFNKFIEENEHIPFTMKNIFIMVSQIHYNTESRMDIAIEEVFNSVTEHYDENRFTVEGWKTNDNYILNKKFIYPVLDHWHKDSNYKATNKIQISSYGQRLEKIEDLLKALCYIEGLDYDDMLSLNSLLSYKYHLYVNGKPLTRDKYNLDIPNYMFTNCSNNIENVESLAKKIKELRPHFEVEVREIDVDYGQWYDWNFFKIKCFKKGSIHFEFKEKDVWARFNQRVSKIKGYPLYEYTEKNNKKRKNQFA